jgi:hypothetical protein
MRPPRLLLLLLLLAAPLLALSAEKGLVFEKTEIELTAPPDADHVDVEFPFANRGSRSVAIIETKAACGCTAAALDKTAYAAGESGTLKVAFTVGQRQGPQRLAIKVRTDAGEHDLLLKVDIPVHATLTPRLVLFRPDAKSPRTARITYGLDTPVEITEIRGLNPAFKATSRAITPGSDYEITIAYSGDAAAIVGSSIDIVSRGASGKIRSDRLFVRHQP